MVAVKVSFLPFYHNFLKVKKWCSSILSWCYC